MMKQNYLKSLFLMLMMLVGMGAWAEEKQMLETFENQATSTTYNSQVTYEASASAIGISWFVEHGAVSTTAKISGEKSLHMRAYYQATSTANVWNGNLPYAETKTPVKGLKSVSFKAAVSNTGLEMDVFYSTDGSSWTQIGDSKEFSSTTSETCSGYEIPSSDQNSNYYIKIGINPKSTHNANPKNAGNYTFRIDDIEFTYEIGGTTPDTPEPTKYNVTVANDIVNGTVTANPISAAEGATVTLTATPDADHVFGSWNVTGATVADASNATTTFTMPAGDVNVSATFNAKPSRPADEIFYESFDTNDGTGGNDDKWSGSIASNKIQQDNDGWTYTSGSGAYQCAKFGAGSSLGSATTPALGQACNATLTFKAAAWNGNSENTTLKLSLVGEGTISPSTVTLTKGAWETYTVTLTGIDAETKIKFEGNSASNSRFFLDEISVIKTGEASVTLSSIAVKTAPTKVTYTEGEYFDPSGLVITKTMSNNTTEDVAYAGNEEDFSFVPSQAEILKASNTSVTITYDGKTATQSITVNPSAIKNTPETAYTTAEAIALINAGEGLATEVYVKGTVSKVDSYNKTYKSITYWLDENSFEIYSGKGINNADFASQEDIEVGAEVVVYGLIKKFVKEGQDDIYEMDKNNYLVSYTAPVSETTYTISVKEEIYNGSVTVSPTEAKTGETVTITATPDEGYEVDEYIAYSTENSTIEVTVTDGTFTMPAYNVTVNVLFKKKQGGETPDTPDTPVVGDGVTYSFGTFTQANDVTFEAEGFTITLHKNTASTAPLWNANSNEARVYAKGSVEVTSTKNIVKVVYDYTENAGGKNNVAPTIDGVTGSAADGTWDTTIKTWTGKDNTVTLTTSGAAGNLGFKSITVYFEEEAVPAPTFASLEDLINADLEEPTVVNVTIDDIVNGGMGYGDNYMVQLESEVYLVAPGTGYGMIQGGTISGTLENVTWDPYNYMLSSETDFWSSLEYTPAGETETITVNQACTDGEFVYGTYSSTNAWYVPEDLIVSEIGIIDGQLVVESYETGDLVPPYTGVMVSATDGGNYKVVIETDYDMWDLAESVLGDDNCLRPTCSPDGGITAEDMEMMDYGSTFYRLTMHNKTQIGFWWGAENGAGFNLGNNKAYLAVPQGAGVKANMWFTGEEDAIKGVEKKTFDTVIYDMQGRKVSKAQKGIYIINGKKVVNK